MSARCARWRWACTCSTCSCARSRRSPRARAASWSSEIRITAAGSAGGTALTLAKLGAEVRSAGAIGTDAVGEMLVGLLERGGIDTSLLVRRDDVQTSASVLPIRPDGERPAFHVVGANAHLRAGRRRLGRARRRDPPAPRRARVHGRRGGGADPRRAPARAASSPRPTCSRPGEPGLLEWIAPALAARSTTSCPTTSRCSAFTGADDLEAGCRALVERGVGCVAATCGADGALIVDADGAERVPAFEIEVVDTTGCGDAFSAGFLRGLSLGRDRARGRRLGCAAAALVAQGLGSRPRRLRPRRQPTP